MRRLFRKLATDQEENNSGLNYSSDRHKKICKDMRNSRGLKLVGLKIDCMWERGDEERGFNVGSTFPLWGNWRGGSVTRLEHK